MLTGHTVLEAHGEDHVTAATIAQVHDSGQPVPGTERRIEVDLICLAVGLRPQTQLAEMLDLEMTHDPRRGGRAPVRDAAMRSSNASLHIAGDLGAISEASIAMEEGRIAGRAAAASLGHGAPGRTEAIISEAQERIRVLDVDIPPLDGPGPMQRGFARDQEGPAGPVPVVECYQRIPCDPCESSCPTGAIRVGRDPTALPTVDADKCTGCLQCVRLCPGMAIFVVESLRERNEAFISMPWEFLPLPERGQVGQGLDRDGQAICAARVVRVGHFHAPGDTAVLTVAVPLQCADEVRGFAGNT
jgi:Fe-S-cluster-containing hydrogenase component 2